MLQTSDGETEILLGNKQLLGIFFVVVILLGVAFAGGYKVGQGSKKAAYTATSTTETAGSSTAGPGETHSVAPEGTSASDPGTASAASAPVQPASSTTESETPAPSPSATSDQPAPLGAAHPKPVKAAAAEDTEAAGPPSATPQPPSHGTFVPLPGQMFLQVAAVGRDEAEGISDVLRKKGFRAHAVPKPGSPRLYRVIIGPVRDASDLSATRTSLRNTGFREIIVQKY